MTLLIGSQEIIPPKIEGCQDVFSSANVVISKPRWVADDQASQCHGCRVRFSHFRRRHHCRHCGFIYCGKCCDQKTLLPYLGYVQPERVCGRCHDMAKLTEQAFSMQMDTKVQALKILATMCKENDQIKNVVEVGGVYALIHSARIHDETIRCLVVRALLGLVVHSSLHQFLADSGAIAAICRILSETDEKCTQLLVDGINGLILFCNSVNMKTEVLRAGALEPLLHLCSSVNMTLALLALHCVSVIVESLDTHDMIVDNTERHTLTRIMVLISSREEQVQELALKTLAHLSSGSDYHRHRIIQEDIFNGNCLTRILGSRPCNKQILCNAACLVANLASTHLLEGSFSDLQMALCRLVEDFPMSEDVLVHCARGIANFSQFPQNANQLLPYLPFLVRVLFASMCPGIRQHALRLCILLLRHCPETVNSLGGPGATVILNGLASIPEVLVAMETEVEKIVPKISQLVPVPTCPTITDVVNR